jgi:hypothetical protein
MATCPFDLIENEAYMRNIVIETCEQRMTDRRRICNIGWFKNVPDFEGLLAELERMGREGLIIQIDRIPGGMIADFVPNWSRS